MLRAPRSLKTHATAPPAGAATSSSGNGALITCSSVNRCCAPIVVLARDVMTDSARMRRQVCIMGGNRRGFSRRHNASKVLGAGVVERRVQSPNAIGLIGSHPRTAEREDDRQR